MYCDGFLTQWVVSFIQCIVVIIVCYCVPLFNGVVCTIRVYCVVCSHLAVSCYENTHECVIVVYSIPDCKDHVRLIGHHGIIYHTHWSHDDTHLLTASQDTTVR